MRLYLTFLVISLAVISATCEVKSENGQAVAKSSVRKVADDEQKTKIDDETKEQLEESENDDSSLEKQAKEAKDGKVSANESSEQENDEGSGEEATVEDAEESEKEDEKEEKNDENEEQDEAAREEILTPKRAEESKGSKVKKGRKLLAYPLFYPGDYFGHHHETGGPFGFHPGSIWEYPYPFVHPMYPSPFYPCQCNCKDDKEKEKDKKEKDKKTRRKQLVPSHYYGPPSAGWGAYQPGHTGGGWGAPYWYKSYIPATMPMKQAPKTEEGHTRHTINDGLDFGLTHTHDTAQVSYGSGREYAGLGLSDDFGAGWHDGYTEHPVYGTYGGGPGRSAFVDPVYGDLENSEMQGWGHGVGRPYLPNQGYGHVGVGHGHIGHQYGVGHAYLPTHAGLNHHAVHNGETFFGPHTAMLPTAQGHIQVASAGHAAGMGGHNLGGFADKIHREQGHEGDFVAGIHADLGSHHIVGHHHDHAASGHINAPLLHTDGLDGDLGDHFGSITTHNTPHANLGMQDHFGPIMEHNGHLGGHGFGHHGGAYAGLHGGFHHGGLHGHGVHAFNQRISHDYGAHAGHGGAFDGHIGDSLSAGHLFGGVHKSGVPEKQKHAKKSKGKTTKHKKKN